MNLPTVVFLLPEKDKQAHLIGKFDKETIQDHEYRFLRGKLPTFDVPTSSKDIIIQDLDCRNLMMEGGDSGSSDLDDEILQEILREEEERRKELEKS